MADKPSRALVVYGDGHAALLPAARAPHLDSFASLASCGFLSLRRPPSSETENERAIRELAQLLDAYDLYMAGNEERNQAGAIVDLRGSSIPKISERFMGLKAAIFTSCSDVYSFATDLGFTAFQLTDSIMQSEASQIVTKLLGPLGFSGGSVLEKSEFDLVFLHVNMVKTKTQKEKISTETGVDWFNKLVGSIMEASPPGSTVASRLHVSVILSFGTVSENKDRFSLVSNYLTETNSDLSLLRPCQSYTMKGGKLLDDVRHDHPMLIAQRQEGVTRRDMAEIFSFDEFIKHGGNLAILADRFLHEVAFKLWKAPKYGA